MPKEMWDRKYRPKNVSGYITQNESQKELIEKWVSEKSIPHLLLAGHHGTGKTSLAYMLKNELDIDDFDFLDINASDDNSVDVVRTKIKSFISGMPVASEFKIVFLDEADRLSAGAQDSLKSMIEEYSHSVRFILTCNKPHKISNEIQSRILRLNFTGPDKISMTERFIEILAAEKIKIKSLELVQEYVDACYPDFRQLLVKAQESIKDGRLVALGDNVSDTTEFMIKIIGFLEADDWASSREYLSKNIPDDKWDECYRFLYEYLHDIGKFKDQKKWKAGIIVIGDHLYKHSFVADAEINFAACLARLSEI